MFDGMIVRRVGRFSAICLGLLLPVNAALLSTAAAAQNSNGNPAAQQPPQAKSLQFEVAAIKPGKPPANGFPGESRYEGGEPGGQVRIANLPLKQWVGWGCPFRIMLLGHPRGSILPGLTWWQECLQINRSKILGLR